MTTLNEEIYRLKEIMGIEEDSNSPVYKGPEGYDDTCDCYPEDEDVVEAEIDEQEEGGGESSGTSTPSMGKWETGVSRGKANPIDVTSKWETGMTRGKGNPVW
jgi:hypothetical protein